MRSSSAVASRPVVISMAKFSVWPASANVDPPLPRRFERYTLLKRLARGGMGEVLLASTGGIEPPAGTAFVRPDLLCEIEFTEMSADGVFRHPSYKGLVAREEPDGVDGGSRRTRAGRPSRGTARR